MNKKLVLYVLALLFVFAVGCDEPTTQPTKQEQPQEVEVFKDSPYDAQNPGPFFYARGQITIDGQTFSFLDGEKKHYWHPRFWSGARKSNMTCYTDYFTTYDETDVVIGASSFFATANTENSCTQGPRSFQMFGDVQITGSGSYSEVQVWNTGGFFSPFCNNAGAWDERAIYTNITFSSSTWYGGLDCDETVSNLSLTESACSGRNTDHFLLVQNNETTKSLTVTRWKFSAYVYTP
ncbi:MAG: hypothetical protein ACREOO_08135 [bacterium]